MQGICGGAAGRWLEIHFIVLCYWRWGKLEMAFAKERVVAPPPPKMLTYAIGLPSIVSSFALVSG